MFVSYVVWTTCPLIATQKVRHNQIMANAVDYQVTIIGSRKPDYVTCRLLTSSPLHSLQSESCFSDTSWWCLTSGATWVYMQREH